MTEPTEGRYFKLPQLRVLPRVLSEAFVKRHSFHVLDNETGRLVGMFASLYCAAQTAMHGNRKKHVMSVESGAKYERMECACVSLNSIVPIFGPAQASGVSVPNAYRNIWDTRV